MADRPVAGAGFCIDVPTAFFSRMCGSSGFCMPGTLVSEHVRVYFLFTKSAEQHQKLHALDGGGRDWDSKTSVSAVVCVSVEF